MLEHLQLELGGELTVLPPLKTRLTLLAEMGNPNLYQFLVKPKSGSDRLVAGRSFQIGVHHLSFE
jgi:hypothetical protein